MMDFILDYIMVQNKRNFSDFVKAPMQLTLI